VEYNKNMLSNHDIEKLTRVLASKADLENLEVRLTATLATKTEVRDINTRLTAVEENMHGIISGLDNLSSVVSDLRLEYGAITNQLTRHENSINILLSR
jgi:flagellin-like hook-associated protein FlgL